MDIEAKPIGNDLWLLTDLLGRKVGTIVESPRGCTIDHDDTSKLAGIVLGPYPSLDQAMSAVGRFTLGQCRRVPP